MASAKSKVDGKRQKTGGRAKGVKNKATKEVIERLKELNCDPIEGMAKIAMNDCPCVSCDETGFITIDINYISSNFFTPRIVIFIENHINCAFSYTYCS